MRATSAVLAALGLLATPAWAAPAAYDAAFVGAFAEACVPGRLGYEATRETAAAAGWLVVDAGANPELAKMMAISEAAANDPELKASLEYTLYQKPVAELPHYLVVSRMVAEVSPETVWRLVGCYLYNFDAAASIDPALVTELIGNPIANSQVDMHISAYSWGPPPAMPRTLDTYMSFVPEVSQYVDETGFSGLVLKFSTAEPDTEDKQG